MPLNERPRQQLPSSSHFHSNQPQSFPHVLNSGPGSDFNEGPMHGGYPYHQQQHQQQPQQQLRQQAPLQPQHQQHQPHHHHQQPQLQHTLQAAPAAAAAGGPIQHAQSQPVNQLGKNESDKKAVNTVWVGRLTKSTTEASLRGFFGSFAMFITSIHLKSGERKGDQYAFVNFSSLHAARSALDKLHGKPLDDCRSVMLRINEQLDQEHFRRLHQGNVPRDDDPQGLGLNGGSFNSAGGAMGSDRLANQYGISNWGSSGPGFMQSNSNYQFGGAANAGTGLSNGHGGFQAAAANSMVAMRSPVQQRLHQSPLSHGVGGGLDPVVQATQRRGYDTIPRRGVAACLLVANLRPDIPIAEMEAYLHIWRQDIIDIRIKPSRVGFRFCCAFIDFKSDAAALDCYQHVMNRPYQGRELTWKIYSHNSQQQATVWSNHDILAGNATAQPQSSMLPQSQFERAIDNLTHGPSFGNLPQINGNMGDDPSGSAVGAAVALGPKKSYIWIGSLPSNVEKEDIYMALSEFADKAIDVRVRTNKKKRTCYAFVDFQTTEIAETAYEACRNRLIRNENVTWKLTDEDKARIIANPSSMSGGLADSPSMVGRSLIYSNVPSGSLTPGHARPPRGASNQVTLAVGPPSANDSDDFETLLSQQVLQQVQQQSQQQAAHATPVGVQLGQFSTAVGGPRQTLPPQLPLTNQPLFQRFPSAGSYAATPSPFPAAEVGGVAAQAQPQAAYNAPQAAAAPVPAAAAAAAPVGYAFHQVTQVAPAAAATASTVGPYGSASAAFAARLGSPQALPIVPRPNAGVIGQQPGRSAVQQVQLVTSTGPHQQQTAQSVAVQPIVDSMLPGAAAAVAAASVGPPPISSLVTNPETHQMMVNEFVAKQLQRSGSTLGSSLGLEWSAQVTIEEDVYKFAKSHFGKRPDYSSVSFQYSGDEAVLTGGDAEKVSDAAVTITYELVKSKFTLDASEYDWWLKADESGAVPLTKLLDKMDLQEKVEWGFPQATTTGLTLSCIGFSKCVMAATTHLTNMRSTAFAIGQSVMELLCAVRPELIKMLCRQYKLFAIGYAATSPKIWVTGENTTQLPLVRQALIKLVTQCASKRLTIENKALVKSAQVCLASLEFDKKVMLTIPGGVDQHSATDQVQCVLSGLDSSVVDRVAEIFGKAPAEESLDVESESASVQLAEISDLYAVSAVYSSPASKYIVRGFMADDVRRAIKGLQTQMNNLKIALIESTGDRCQWFRHNSTVSSEAKDVTARIEERVQVVMTASTRFIEVHGDDNGIAVCRELLTPLLDGITSVEIEYALHEGLIPLLEERVLRVQVDKRVYYTITNRSKVLEDLALPRPISLPTGNNTDILVKLIGPSELVYQAVQDIKRISQHQGKMELTAEQLQTYEQLDPATRDALYRNCGAVVERIPGTTHLHLCALTRNNITSAIDEVKSLLAKYSVAQHSLKLPLLSAKLFATNATVYLTDARDGHCAVALGTSADWSSGILNISGYAGHINNLVSEIGQLSSNMSGCIGSVSVSPSLAPLVLDIWKSLKEQAENQYNTKVHIVQRGEGLMLPGSFKYQQFATIDLTAFATESILRRNFMPVEVYLEALGFFETSATDTLTMMLDGVQRMAQSTITLQTDFANTLFQYIQQDYHLLVERFKAALDVDLATGTVAMVTANQYVMQQTKMELASWLGADPNAFSAGATVMDLSQQGLMLQATAPGASLQNPGASANAGATEILAAASSQAAAADPTAALVHGMASLSFDGQSYLHTLDMPNDRLIAQELFQRQLSLIANTASHVKAKCDPVLDDQGVLKQIKISGPTEGAVRHVSDIIHQHIESISQQIRFVAVSINPVCVPSLLTGTVCERLAVLEGEHTMEWQSSEHPQTYLNTVKMFLDQQQKGSQQAIFNNQHELCGFKGLPSQYRSFAISIRCFHNNAERCVEQFQRYLESTIEERQTMFTVREEDRYQLNMLAATMCVELNENDTSYIGRTEGPSDVNVYVRGHAPRPQDLIQKWQEMCWSNSHHQ
ncbi:uncharacterized protein LOC135828759 isoform X2 [Sycon ciliatum]|uniref:uncharacterized protein LOC135828759 isoform X2 n=1 Tax=Sycon ciliatum TaxID=27933 RepID=UPI0031F703E9